MYAVVGCRECGAFWIVQDQPETTRCQRCGTRHPYDRLKKFVQTDDVDHAREVRSRLLAEQSGYAEEYDAVESFTDLANGSYSVSTSFTDSPNDDPSSREK